MPRNMGLKQNQGEYRYYLNPIDRTGPFWRYYGIRRTAKLIRVHPHTIEQRIKKGTIAFIRINDRAFMPSWAVEALRVGDNKVVRYQMIKFIDGKAAYGFVIDREELIRTLTPGRGEYRVSAVEQKVNPREMDRNEEIFDSNGWLVFAKEIREVEDLGLAIYVPKPLTQFIGGWDCMLSNKDKTICKHSPFTEEMFQELKRLFFEESQTAAYAYFRQHDVNKRTYDLD